MQFVGLVLLVMLIFLGLNKMIKLFLGFGGLLLLGLFWYFKNGSKEASTLLTEGEEEFKLSKGELAEISKYDKAIVKCNAELEELRGLKKMIKGKIQNLYDIGAKHDLRIRNDNYFDNRNAKGKELNQNILAHESELSSTEKHISKSVSNINNLTESQNKIKDLPNDRKFYKTARTVMLCTIGLYTVFVLYYFSTH